MGFDPFAVFNEGPRNTRMILLGIILLTLPCYCLGFVLLATAPSDESVQQAPDTTNPPLGARTMSPAMSATFTPFFTWTPPGPPLVATATQLYLQPTLPVFFPTFALTAVPTVPAVATNTPAPTLTPFPTNTLPPTAGLPTAGPPIVTDAAPGFPTPTQELNQSVGPDR